MKGSRYPGSFIACFITIGTEVAGSSSTLFLPAFITDRLLKTTGISVTRMLQANMLSRKRTGLNSSDSKVEKLCIPGLQVPAFQGAKANLLWNTAGKVLCSFQLITHLKDLEEEIPGTAESFQDICKGYKNSSINRYLLSMGEVWFFEHGQVCLPPLMASANPKKTYRTHIQTKSSV